MKMAPETRQPVVCSYVRLSVEAAVISCKGLIKYHHHHHLLCFDDLPELATTFWASYVVVLPQLFQDTWSSHVTSLPNAPGRNTHILKSRARDRNKGLTFLISVEFNRDTYFCV